MTEDEFITDIADRHQSQEVTGAVLRDIREMIHPLDDHDRQDLFDHYKKEWRSTTCPRAGFFADALKGMGKEVKVSRGVLQGAWVCADCGTRYSIDSQGCPRCKSGVIDHITDAAHPAVVEVKMDCWQCGVYHDDGKGKFGPECEKWGTGERPYDYCRDCRCKPCCIYEYNFRRDRTFCVGHTVEKNMPWIKGGLK